MIPSTDNENESPPGQDQSWQPEKRLQVPVSVLNERLEEIDWVLEVVDEDQTLPLDISGHVFFVFARQPRNIIGGQIFNGDGMVCRLDFVQNDDKLEHKKVVTTLKTRIAKTPCYYVDQLLNQDKRYSEYRFDYAGLVQVGKLGARNQLNTAFLRIDKRLLLTFDGGRAYEIDPTTLELLQPLGKANLGKDKLGKDKSWQSPTQNFNQLFLPYQIPAHPVYDFTNHAVITANYFTGFSRFVPKTLLKWIASLQGKKFGSYTQLVYVPISSTNTEQTKPDLADWQRLNITLADGSPVIIDQSLHQLAITERYIILVDIGFQMEFSYIFFTPIVRFIQDNGWIGGLFKVINQRLRAAACQKSDSSRGLLAKFNQYLQEKVRRIKTWLFNRFFRLRPQKPLSNLYIIDREELYNALNDLSSENIIAKKIVLPREISHFVANYSNPHDQITLHLAHNNAYDVTEWISEFDENPLSLNPNYPYYVNLRRDLAGMIVGPMDLGSVAKYVINGKSGVVLESNLISDIDKTWAVSLYTFNESQTDEILNIYWLSWGFSLELIPKRIFDSYKNYPYRSIPIENISRSEQAEGLPFEDKPITLIRLNTVSMKIEDWYEFPVGYYASSPQFVPRKPDSSIDSKSSNLSTDGYIICTVTSDQKNRLGSTDEIWIFDAADLQGRKHQQPLCKLGHQKLDLKLTIHSTWLPELKQELLPEDAQKLRRKTFEDDYQSFLNDPGKFLKDFPRPIEPFQDLLKEAKSHFIHQTLESKLHPPHVD